MMAATSSHHNAAEAPRFHIPTERIVSVEHPCIIKNVDRGIDMLGGGRAVSETLDHASETTLPLRFNPHGQSIISMNNRANNILLRISVPKRIGKRKRGSNEPFQPIEADEDACSAPDLLKSIKDNPRHVQLLPLGKIENSHIFRTLPDFAFSTSDSKFKSEIKTKLIGQDLKTIKTFELPASSGLQNTEMFPPPILSTFSFPQTYSYLDKQPNKAKAKDAAQAEKTPIDIRTVNDLDTNWPTEAPTTLPRSKPVRALLPILQELFADRPLFSHQALASSLPSGTKHNHVTHTLPYVAFQVLSGPWAAAFCRYGVDPRTSSEFAIYQTIDIPSESDTAPLKQQLIDIQSPPRFATLISNISASTHLRTGCEPVYHGWYHNGTLAKLHALLRVKGDDLVKAEDPATGDDTLAAAAAAEDYDALLALPDRVDLSNDNAAAAAAAANRNSTEGPSSELARRLTEEYFRSLREGEAIVRERVGGTTPP